nr:DNA internalization-related competence protein ComEC/Rec2 [Shewanella mangrovi]
MLPLLSLPIVAGALLLCVSWLRKHRFRGFLSGIAGVLVGVIWITAYCHWLLPSAAVEQQSSVRGHTTPLTVRAEIISLVSRNGDWISVDVQQVDNSASFFAAKRWRLGWDLRDEKQTIRLPNVGEIWQFELTPKVFSSVLNEGGFNQQRYLISQHISARARVINAALIQGATGVRATLLASLNRQLESVDNRDILLALTMGERNDISRARWQQLRNSGTAHLVAISGLHLSVISLYLFALVKSVLNWLRPVESRRNLIIANLSAVAVAVLYAWLAGFGVPVQRALLMLLVVVLSQLTMRNAVSWERLLWALALVLLADPLAPLSNGFWLSFFALAIILSEWYSQRDWQHDETLQQRLIRGFIALWRIQWRLCLGMSLLQAILFGGITLHSFWINLLLVPWFSFVVIPLVMISFCMGMLLTALGAMPVATTIWQWTNLSLLPAEWLWQLSTELAAAWIPISASFAWALLLAVGSLVLGWHLLTVRHRYWLLLPCVPLMLQLTLLLDWLTPARWQLHIVDVGQGLAVIAQQGKYGLLYDTGASFDDFSYAERAILPLLRQRGISELEYLILSHGDNDHAGGAQVISAHYPQAKVITDLTILPATDNCRPHTVQWRKLTLNFLGPLAPARGNNGSCVMQLTDEKFSVLLPGDIELPAEIGLVKSDAQLNSDLLLVPHHGSASSSTEDFIQAVSPRWAIFAAGFHNRWRFPKQDVLQRYHTHGVTTFVSGEQGQISVDVNPVSQNISSYRAQIAPYWYNRLIAFGNPVDPE